MASEQLDLLAMIEASKLDLPAPSLFASPTRGVKARLAEFEAWCRDYGAFGSLARSHAWVPSSYLRVQSSGEITRTRRCLPTILSADLRCPGGAHGRGCCCVGDLVERGACQGCEWEGPVRGKAAEAVADGHDHAWPGWRDLPIVPRPPEAGTSKKEIAARLTWQSIVDASYPDGWLAAGGPIVTQRAVYGT